MKVAINGLGRIGRAVFKIAIKKGVNIVAVNDLNTKEQLKYLLEDDSVYGKYDKDIKIKRDNFLIGKKKILVLNEKDPEKLPWKKLGVDVVIESTGAFTRKKDASKHLKAGAKKVLVSAPCKDKCDFTIVLGVNDKGLKKSHKIISVASCTTNCIAPVLKVLNDEFGIKKAMFTTIHAYTSSQNVVDNPSKKIRRGKSAGLNIIPTTTGASKSVFEVLPELKGKVKGFALRVPVPVGSVSDITAQVEKKVDVNKVNNALKKASKGKMKGVLEYSKEELEQ